MDKSLLDTDIFSEVLKAKNPSVVQIARTYRQQFARYTISAVTVTEMVKGFEKMGRDDLDKQRGQDSLFAYWSVRG